MDLTGINNQNEYYTNHYLNVLFEDSAADRVKEWTARAKESSEFRTPWSQLRLSARQYFAAHDRYIRAPGSIRTLSSICSLADGYLRALGFPEAKPAMIPVEDISVPVYLEMVRSNKAPLLWVLLAASSDPDLGVLESSLFSPPDRANAKS